MSARLRFVLRLAPVVPFLIACGGGGGGDVTDPDPPTPEPPTVATIDVSPSNSSVLAGTSVSLSAVARSGAGSAISGKVFAWSSSAPAVASVSNGTVTALAPGSATITASVDGKSGSAAIEVVNPLEIPAFVRPFGASVDYFSTNYHDHDIPQAFLDNGRRVTYWGERVDIIGYEGHEGYDWRMAEGTPILAAAAGTVVSLSSGAFFCPLLNANIPADGNGIVIIEHALPGSVVIRTLYAHLSRKDVTVGQAVTAGQQIGLSGTVGCSLNPHLHFGVRRMTQTNNGQPSMIDPYGWSGATADPWVGNAEGATSIRLWRPGEAPSLAARFTVPVNTQGSNLFFGLSQAQPVGVDDAANPNNEYVEISRDPAFAPAMLDIGGATITTRAGLQYTMPAGTTLSAANPTIRVYTGSGTNSANTLYMGKPAGIYDNVRECISAFNAAGQVRNRIALGSDGCGP